MTSLTSWSLPTCINCILPLAILFSILALLPVGTHAEEVSGPVESAECLVRCLSSCVPRPALAAARCVAKCVAQCPLPGPLPSLEPKKGQIKNLKTSIHKEWKGGFIGRIEIDIPREITEWSMKLEFRRKIYSIEVSNICIMAMTNLKKYSISPAKRP